MAKIYDMYQTFYMRNLFQIMFLNFCSFLKLNRHILGDFFKDFLQFFSHFGHFHVYSGQLKQNFVFLSILRAFPGLFRSFYLIFDTFLRHLGILNRYLALLNIILTYFFNHLCGFRPLLDYFIDLKAFEDFSWLFEFHFEPFF